MPADSVSGEGQLSLFKMLPFAVSHMEEEKKGLAIPLMPFRRH
jgi:hypothetical protein